MQKKQAYNVKIIKHFETGKKIQGWQKGKLCVKQFKQY